MPSVSVVIPTTDWDEMLWRLELNLLGLSVQTVVPQEVVVVDSIGKTDKVAQLVSKFENRLNIHAEQLPYSDIIFRAGSARNKGVKSLRQSCDRILFLDSDVVPFPRVVESHQTVHAPMLIGLGLRSHIKPTKQMHGNLQAVYNAKVIYMDHRIQSGAFHKDHRCCHSHNLSFCSELFNKIGGFWPMTVVCEDLEIGIRAERAGCTYEYVHHPKVRHINHPLWRPIIRTGGVGLPKWHVMPRQSQDIPGYTRETPDFLKWE